MEASIGVVILAAGGSSRLGQPKQLLPYQGRTLLRHAAETAVASGCRPIIAVLGANAESLRGELTGLPVWTVENEEWESGMGISIAAGVQPLTELEHLDGAIILVADQPLITPEFLRDLVAQFEETLAPVVASEYVGTLGVPALFAETLFPELLALGGAGGAKQVIAKYHDRTTSVVFDGGAMDIDTPEDAEALYRMAVG
jgi:molybdenum cofactor cytidylyltransferase